LHRILGLVSLRLNDRTTGKQALKLAFEMSPSDISAGSILSSELRKDQDLLEAHLIAKKIVESGWLDPILSSAFHAGILMQNYYLPLIWLGETEQVIEDTKDWKTKGSLRVTYGIMRAMAFRQSVESKRDNELIQHALCLAAEVLDEVFTLDGYARFQVAEGMKLIEQLAYITRGNQELCEELKIKFTYFVDKHLFILAQQHNTYTLDNPEVMRWIQEMSTLTMKNGNPLLSDRWQRLKTDIKSNMNIIENIEEGRVQVAVVRMPNRPFLFAEDKSGKTYFVHRDTLEFEAQIWNDLMIGDYLEVLPQAYPPEEGKYTRATMSRLLE
jgi:hypothetical protein